MLEEYRIHKRLLTNPGAFVKMTALYGRGVPCLFAIAINPKAHTIVKLLPKEHAHLVQHALQAARAAGDLPDFPLPVIEIQPARRADQGDYNTGVALQLAKPAGKKPREVAEIIVKHLPPADFVEKVEVAGPGFINFTLSKRYVKQQVEAIIAEGENLFALDIGTGKRAQVEFVSANPSGPITIGHTRGAVIGDAMARLLEAAGYTVQREYYFNNAGNQMVKLGQSMQARYLQALGKEAEIPEGGYYGQYLIEQARELAANRGAALMDADWPVFKDYAEQKMFEWIKKSLKSIDIEHDAFFNEDSLFQNGAIWQVLDELRSRGYIYEAAEWEGATDEEKTAAAWKKPAIWFRSTRLGDQKDRVMVKSDGVPTYTLPDIAYHKNKLERGFDVLVNVLGSDHYTEAQVVRRGLQALGLNPEPLHVIFNQMVQAVRFNPETGKLEEVKQSKRAGTFDTLDDLVEMTSPDAVRYHLLARSPDSQLAFNVEEVVKQSNENPVYYIQNAHVRCWGIFREAEARGVSDDGADVNLLGEEELPFIRKMLEMGEVIETAVTHFEPHRIAFYALELAGVFHPIYDSVRVLHSEVPPELAKARLRFYRAARLAFWRVLRLMGMSAPERM